MADHQSIPDHIHAQAESWWNRRERGEPGIEDELDAWLRSDPLHRRAFEAIGTMWDASRRLADRPMGHDRQLPRAPFYMRHTTHMALATLGGIAALLLVTTWALRTLSEFAPVTAVYAADFATGRGEIRTFKVAGGASLVLDTLSHATVARNGATYRLTLLAGRARVHAAGTNQPWLIVAGGTQTHVSGATYDVSVVADEPRLVAVDRPVEMSAEAGKMSFSVGSAARLGCKNCDPISVARRDAEWVSGMLVFEAMPLDEAVRIINRYNTVQVRLIGTSIGGRRITGAFRASDPRAFARAMAALFDQKIDVSRKSEIVLTPS